jgi:hypothetical protein
MHFEGEELTHFEGFDANGCTTLDVTDSEVPLLDWMKPFALMPSVEASEARTFEQLGSNVWS